MAAVINLLSKDLRHGMQQQPQVTIMAVKMATETRIDVTKFFYTSQTYPSRNPTYQYLPQNAPSFYH